MPYKIIHKGNLYELRLIEGNKLLGVHTSKIKAEKQRMAIEINKHKKSKKK
jgi:hypothetical protein